MLLAQETRGAGGAALDQIAIASGAAALLTAGLLALGWGHRTGRITVLARAAAWAERTPVARGLPGWAGLPTLVAMASLITALLGMYWDISLHITNGRDEGPLANIAHYPILVGLFGIFTAGVLAVVLPPDGERPGPAAVRIAGDWSAPVGGLLLTAAGSYALLGFPLDDVWHRVFGQDVTLWGPTHLMLIGGAGLSLVALAVLDREGRLVRGDAQRPLARYLYRGMMTGGLLIGLSVFQAEWDFGVPQFRMVHQPYLIAVAAACALVTARLWVGRGAALFAVGFYLVVRGGVAVVVGPVLGELWAAVPLYLAEALLVEALALVVALRRRRLAFGAVAGVLVGTAGFAAEYVWTQVAFPLPWAPDMVGEGVLHGVLGGVAGGVLGGLLVLGLEGGLPRPAVARSLFAACLALVALCAGNALVHTVPTATTAEVALGPVRDGDAAGISVRFSPPVDGPTWVTVTAWQGGGLVVEPLAPTGDGRWATDAAVPVDGDWKTLVRLHDGRDMAGIEVFLPEDAVLGEPEVPAVSGVRPAVPEQQVLQRELQDGVPPWLFPAGSLVVLALSLALVGALGAGVARVSRAAPERVAA